MIYVFRTFSFLLFCFLSSYELVLLQFCFRFVFLIQSIDWFVSRFWPVFFYFYFRLTLFCYVQSNDMWNNVLETIWIIPMSCSFWSIRDNSVFFFNYIWGRNLMIYFPLHCCMKKTSRMYSYSRIFVANKFNPHFYLSIICQFLYKEKHNNNYNHN